MFTITNELLKARRELKEVKEQLRLVRIFIFFHSIFISFNSYKQVLTPLPILKIRMDQRLVYSFNTMDFFMNY